MVEHPFIEYVSTCCSEAQLWVHVNVIVKIANRLMEHVLVAFRQIKISSQCCLKSRILRC